MVQEEDRVADVEPSISIDVRSAKAGWISGAEKEGPQGGNGIGDVDRPIVVNISAAKQGQ